MTDRELLSHIDHTLLKAAASWEDIKKLCDEAVRYRTASVCIPPSYVKPVHETYGEELTVCTVIGFPLGYSVGAVKIREAEIALAEGARKIDLG
ncbi:MAG: hypothetical protein LBT93_08310 [Treponema sp.]|jgi:deoxyribose-phosphate aldolase|nr:hypothetical protein [Treponema sp.]